MPRYIDADAFIAEKRSLYCKDCDMRMGVYEIGDAPCKSCGINDMLDALDDFPAADVAPVVHARWMRLLENDFGWKFSCHNCLAYTKVRTKFCPHCGARMDEKENEE